MTAQTAAFQRSGDSNGFQLKETHSFSAWKHTSRRLKRKKTPEYRRISRYFKSSKQYWKERKRRKRAYELHVQGLPYGEIGEQLGVCAKTVAKDIAKVRPYYLGQINGMLQKVREERGAEEAKRYENMTLRERATELRKMSKFVTKMWSTRQQLSETLHLTVRVNELLRALRNPQAYGRPFMKLHPKTITLPMNRLRLKVQFVNGSQDLGSMTYQAGKW